MRHYVLVQKLKSPPDRDGYGDPIVSWQDVGNAWASIDPPSLTALAGAREAIMAGAETDVNIVLIGLDPIVGAEAGWRVTDTENSRIYDLKAVRELNDGSMMTFIATEGASNG